MKKLFILIIGCFSMVDAVFSQSLSFKTYMNPVIPGDHPDCTVSRIGDDYYTTGSSFNVTPTIYHSTDLVHWEAISQPVSASWDNYGDKPGGGCWGGHIVFYKGKYWDFFSRANIMHFVTADKPEGPWSVPVRINDPSQLSYGLGYDNSIYIDDDGKWYLLVKNGQANGAIVELGDNGQPTGVVYDLNWLNPAPSYPYSWAEGPVMWKYKGYYYYSFARDLAGGQKVMRSKTITAEQSAWEMQGDFFNENDPAKASSKFTSPNHASNAVMLNDSTLWVIHPLYAKGEWKGQGRQGLLNQVRYDANGKPTADYPVNKYFSAPKLPSGGIPWMVPKSDFFNSEKMNPEWSKLGYTTDDKFSLTEKPGWLRLSPKTDKINTLTKNDGEHNYSLITKVDFDAKTTSDQAGLLILRGDETMFVKLCLTRNNAGQKVINFIFNESKFEAENKIGNTVWLKIERVNHKLTGYYSNNGFNWSQVGDAFDVSVIDAYSDFVSFTGTRQGLYVQNSPAYFDLYVYRDAYSPILAECPVNQFGTSSTTLQDGIYLLDSIHNNDWALYAGVEFGNNEYNKASDSIQIIASSATTGGNVEVWLDSIDTGTKIGTCIISNTGNWNTFKNFTVKITKTTGRHDVYLKFTGSSGNLFKLKWIKFITANPQYVSSYTTSDSTIIVTLNNKIIEPVQATGFIITLNGSEKDSITKAKIISSDSLKLSLTLHKKLSSSDVIKINYKNGNIFNRAGLELASFSDTTVENYLPGSAPRILGLESGLNGETIYVKFNKKMSSPSSYAGNFKVFTDLAEIKVNSVILKNGDSTTFVFTLNQKVYFENTINLEYTGTEVKSADNGIVKNFKFPVSNFSNGYPPVIKSSKILKNGNLYKIIILKFDKPVASVSDQKDFFTIKINGQSTTIISGFVNYDSVRFSINTAIKYGDDIKLSYSGSNIISLRNGKLENFSDYTIENSVPVAIENIKFDNNVNIYPNPATTELNIRSEFEFNSISIFDISGKMVLKEKYGYNIKSARIQIDLNKGTYVIQIKNGNSSSYSKIVIR